MVSPNLVSKKIVSGGEEFNLNAKKLFQAIYNDLKADKGGTEGGPKIQVSDLISKMAFVYEKLRNAVDYKEDHLLRKGAIARILKRHVVIEGWIKDQSSLALARHLLIELIRAGYLPNNSLPETKIDEVALILDKYLKLRIYSQKALEEKGIKISKLKNEFKEKNSLGNWIFSLAACEIEERLVYSQTKEAMVNVMFDTLSEIIDLPADLPYEKDLAIQIYLAISRHYLHFDIDLQNFVLFKYYNRDWTAGKIDQFFSPKEEEIQRIAKSLLKLREQIDTQLKHPLKKQLDRVVKRYAMYFTIFQETIADKPAQIYNDFKQSPKTFIREITKVCNLKYKKAKSKLWRAAIRSIIYIFLTKSIFVFLIEIPAIHWFNEPLNTMALAINVAFPAVLLFFIVAFTRTPKQDNTDYIIEGIQEISFLSQAENKKNIILRNPKKRSRIYNLFFGLLYMSTFSVSIYVILYGLNILNFNWVSMIIFLFFLAFASFFGLIVTRGVKDLLIIERRENLFTLLTDLFYMPIVLAGKWLSNNISKINIFIFIFDFIIEAPFKILVEVAEEWTRYVKERRDNMV